MAQCRPCAFLMLAEPGEGLPGGGRLGGRPDAPPGAHWPLSPDGSPMAFVLQVPLRDPALPLAGLLSVFVGEFAGGYDVPHRLWLTPPETPLRPIAPPDLVAHDLFGDLPPHRLELRLGADLPRWATNDYAAVVEGLSDDALNAYEELASALEPEPQARRLGKLFGHVAGIGSDPREDAVVWEEAPSRMYDRSVTGPIRASIRGGARLREWTNLLLIDSCQALDLCIGDAGYLQVMAKSAALARGEPGQTYGQLESG